MGSTLARRAVVAMSRPAGVLDLGQAPLKVPHDWASARLPGSHGKPRIRYAGNQIALEGLRAHNPTALERFPNFALTVRCQGARYARMLMAGWSPHRILPMAL